jgi:hypothetical protein
VTLFMDGGFKGYSKTVTSDQYCFGGDWNDKVSSLIVERDNGYNGGNGGGYSGGDKATVYADCGYGGRSYALAPGRYDAYALGIGNDQMSSIKVPQGMRVTLFMDGGFKGYSKTVTSDQYCFGGDWNDKVSSLIVERDNGYNGGGGNSGYTGPKVFVYGDCNFRGASTGLAPGRYDSYSLGVGNDKISSLKVPSGMKITVYADGGFRGESRTFYGDQYCFGSDWNDRISSVVVEYN